MYNQYFEIHYKIYLLISLSLKYKYNKEIWKKNYY